MVLLSWGGTEAPDSAGFFEVRRLSNSEKSSLTVPLKLLKSSKDPEAGLGLAAPRHQLFFQHRRQAAVRLPKGLSSWGQTVCWLW